MNLQQMRDRRAAIIAEAQAVLAAIQATPRALTDDERARLDAIQAENEQLKADIRRLEVLDEEIRAATRPTREPLHDDASTATRERAWNGMGEFLQAVARAGQPGGRIDRRLLEGRAAIGAGESIPSDGGFLVDPQMSQELLMRTYNAGILASRARRIPSSSGSSSLRLKAIDETSRANGSRFGSVQAFWADEGDALTQSRPKFRQIELNLHKLTGLYYATDELLEDAAALEALAGTAFEQEFAFKLDDAMMRGTGAGQPLGVLNAACTVSVSKETGQAAATVMYENIVKMYSRLWGPSMLRAVWFINQDVLPQLFQMSLSVGTGGAPVFIPANAAASQPFNTLLGRPIIPIEHCATLGTVGDIILADFGEYILYDKGGVKQASSIHVRFVNDEMTFRWTMRLDGQPWWASALTPFQGTNTLSPFVVLATRA